MADVNATADAIHASANRLYWLGHDSVEQLAARLGLSRHALYASIRPAPAGAQCAACGAEMVFANRNRRAHGQAACTACGAEETVAGERAALVHASPPPAPLRRQRRSAVRRILRVYLRDLRRVRPERAAMIGGAAAMGMAAAMVAGEVVRGLGRW
jgi:hypothetical protein